MPTTTTSSSWQPIRIDLFPFLHSSSSPLNTEAKQATVVALRHACKTDGLFLLDYKGWIRESRNAYPDAEDVKRVDQRNINSATSPYSIQRNNSSDVSTKPPVLDAISSFFALPLEQKQALPSVHSDGFSRGYIPLMGESGLKAQYCEWKEGFSLGYEEKDEEKVKDKGKEEGESCVASHSSIEKSKGEKQQQAPQQPQRRSSNPLEGPNVWPSSPTALKALRGGGRGGGEGWKEELMTFFRDLIILSEALTRALSLALYQEEEWLGGVCGKGGERISLLRAFHYFPSSSLPPSIPPSRAVGSSPHTDWGLFTIILEEGGGEDVEEGGLQIRRRRLQRQQEEEGGGEGMEEEFEWVGVRAAPGTLIVNCGDFLSLVSRRVLGGMEGRREGGMGDKEEEESGREGREGRAPFFQSPVHRVILAKEQHRTSLVFFYYPSFDAVMQEGGREERRVGEPYNTLLQVEEEDGGEKRGRERERRTAIFGEHIMRKWAGVKSS